MSWDVHSMARDVHPATWDVHSRATDVYTMAWDVHTIPWNVYTFWWNVNSVPWDVYTMPWDIYSAIRNAPTFWWKFKKLRNVEYLFPISRVHKMNTPEEIRHYVKGIFSAFHVANIDFNINVTKKQRFFLIISTYLII